MTWKNRIEATKTIKIIKKKVNSSKTKTNTSYGRLQKETQSKNKTNKQTITNKQTK